jgi:hypothetical protein
MNVASCGAGSQYAHRLTRANLHVVGRDGTPRRGVSVSVEQVQHAFGFGNIGFDFLRFKVFSTAVRQVNQKTRARRTLVLV